MPQVPVIGYFIQVSTAPPQPAPGAPPTAFIPGISIQTAANPNGFRLPINTTEEFMAAMALIQAPGRLLFDSVGGTLEKLFP